MRQNICPWNKNNLEREEDLEGPHNTVLGLRIVPVFT